MRLSTACAEHWGHGCRVMNLPGEFPDLAEGATTAIEHRLTISVRVELEQESAAPC